MYGSVTVAAQSRNATEFSRIQLQQLTTSNETEDGFDRLSLCLANQIAPKIFPTARSPQISSKGFSLSILSLAVSYFHRGLPPNYRRRCSVSLLSSGWIRVVPLRHYHQANLLGLNTLKAAYPSKEVFLIFLISKKTEDKPSVC